MIIDNSRIRSYESDKAEVRKNLLSRKHLIISKIFDRPWQRIQSNINILIKFSY